MQLLRTILSITLLVTLPLVYSCAPSEPESLLQIAISKERTGENKYSDWLYHQDIAFEYIDLSDYTLNEAIELLSQADALLLSGGNDIYPGWYGKEYDTARCGVFNRLRDTLEMMALSKALDMKMPVLGICRGMQLINIHQGGTLHIDLPADKGTGEIHRRDSLGWAEHMVLLQPESILSGMINQHQVPVASNHHQGIEILAEILKPLAYSLEDNLIEAICFKEESEEVSLLAVQWHPEWMSYDDKLSSEIAYWFLNKAETYRNAHLEAISER